MKNILRILVVLLSSVCSISSFAQQLDPGDIMIIGFMGDGNGEPAPVAPSGNCGDGFSFVCLANIPDGVQVIFTEEEWTTSGFNLGNEGHVIWTNNTGGAISAGTVIQVTTNGQQEVAGGFCSGDFESEVGSVVFGDDGSGTDNWALSSSDEEIYVYQGTPGSPTNWISAFFTDGFVANNSVPPVLNNFVVNLGSPNPNPDADIAIYTGATNCSDPSECITNIKNPLNWSTDDGAGFQCCDDAGADYPDDVPASFVLCIPSTPLTGVSTSLEPLCLEQSTDLSATGGIDGTGSNIVWYDGPDGTGNQIGTGANLTVSPTATTTYYVRREGDCNTTDDASVVVTVNIPSTPLTSITTSLEPICLGLSTELSASGGTDGTGSSVVWYDGPNGTGNQLGTGANLTVFPPATTTYYVRREGACNTTEDASVVVTVNTLSTPLANVSATANPICPGQPTNIYAAGGTSGTASTIVWYDGPGGTGNQVGIGANLTVSPMVTTTYYVRREGDCNTTDDASVTIVAEDNVAPIITCPADVTLSSDANCENTVPDFMGGIAVSDNCSVTDEITITQAPLPGTTIGVGTTIIILTAIDAAGNTSNCSVNVTLEDDLPPSISCPANIILSAGANCENTIPDLTGGITISDNCSNISSISVIQSPAAGTTVGVGITSVTFTATDEAGNSASCTMDVEVIDDTSPIVVTNDIHVSLDALGYAYISPSDVDNGSFDACGIVNLYLNVDMFDCAHIGDNMVILTTEDANGNSTSESAIVTVTNDLPTITNITLPLDPQQINESIMATAHFMDMNPVSAIFDWGDGTMSDGIIGSGTIEGSHQYLTSDLYTVSLVLTDVCGETDVQYFYNLVVLDDNGGRVHGKGTIWSDMGDYLDDPQSEGKANFKIDVKYKKESKKGSKKKDDEELGDLDGKTEFKFKDGHLDFKSTFYEWLVIAGNKVVFKGEGKVNRAEGYEFMLSAIVGKKKQKMDKFRIKIWEIGGRLIYDNQPGEPDDAELITSISKSSLHIHNKKPKPSSRIAGAEFKQEMLIESSEISVYPNPFEFQSTIEFVLPYDSRATVDIYSLTGVRLKTLFDEDVLANQTYSVVFDKEFHSDQIFIYKISTAFETRHGKLISK